MMVKVLLCTYATGTFSWRKIAAKLHEDGALRVLGTENFPAHRTISDFRARHIEEFETLFVQLVVMAREAGLVKLGTVTIDGTNKVIGEWNLVTLATNLRRLNGGMLCA